MPSLIKYSNLFKSQFLAQRKFSVRYDVTGYHAVFIVRYAATLGTDTKAKYKQNQAENKNYRTLVTALSCIRPSSFNIYLFRLHGQPKKEGGGAKKIKRAIKSKDTLGIP